jgi:uncharacterized RDD family membrane protein YckC
MDFKGSSFMATRAPLDFRQHLEVETPEHVVLDYEIAGLGSRALAAIIDTLILIGWSMALLVVFALLSFQFEDWAGRSSRWCISHLSWGYFAFFEGFVTVRLRKRRLGIRVVRDTGIGHLRTAAVRNLIRAADFLPPPYLIGGILVALHPRAKRLGDLVAGTVVVRDDPPRSPSGPRESRCIRRGRSSRAGRRGVPSPAGIQRTRLGSGPGGAAASRHSPRREIRRSLSQSGASPESFLADLYRDELARRRGRFGARGEPRATERRGQTTVAERMAARKTERWQTFQGMADRAAREGLDSFNARELPDFAARYREVAADLARARTYRADPSTLARLERLVVSGHNALYRDERNSINRIWQVVMRECPAAVVQARRYVLIAFLAFAVRQWRVPPAEGTSRTGRRASPRCDAGAGPAGASRIGQGKGTSRWKPASGR